jgi:hypothetical protein
MGREAQDKISGMSAKNKNPAIPVNLRCGHGAQSANNFFFYCFRRWGGARAWLRAKKKEKRQKTKTKKKKTYLRCSPNQLKFPLVFPLVRSHTPSCLLQSNYFPLGPKGYPPPKLQCANVNLISDLKMDYCDNYFVSIPPRLKNDCLVSNKLSVDIWAKGFTAT